MRPGSISLDAVRTDGWFETMAEEVGSFQAICEIIGERFFAFSLAAGVRIVALTVDRAAPEDTLVEFGIDAGNGRDAKTDTELADTRKLPLPEFRRQLVAALVTPEPTGPVPAAETDTEGVQRFIGLRSLLLASLFGYSLESLTLSPHGAAMLSARYDGVEQSWTLEAFRARLRSHVRDELRRASKPVSHRDILDFSRVEEAAAELDSGNPQRVVELLGAWPSPLSILLRTPEGQLLTPEARATLARGLALLGLGLERSDQQERAEDVLRLALQYAAEHPIAAEVFASLGEILQDRGRTGEAIGYLRRAVNLGAPGAPVWSRLARAFLDRGRHLAALGALLEASDAGCRREDLTPLHARLAEKLGAPLAAWSLGARIPLPAASSEAALPAAPSTSAEAPPAAPPDPAGASEVERKGSASST